MPYQYPFKVPLRSGPDSWPGNGNGWLIGASGDVLEMGMFVLNAELRKWALSDENLLQNGYKVYTHPDVTPSGFEPKPNGDTLSTGNVGDVAALADVDNIEQMRFMLNTLLNRYDNDTDYFQADFRRAWITGAYPTNPSGHLYIGDGGFFFSLFGRTWLRPVLDDITGGDEMTDTDLHWLGGSGVLFDMDMGEVVFQPFPFPGESHRFKASEIFDDPLFHFSPFLPPFQKTDGTILSMTGRERSSSAQGTFKVTADIPAIASGKLQFDGYAILPETKIRLIDGKDNEWNFVGDGSADFINPIQGLREVNGNIGDNDDTARTYWTATPQSSGVYRIITSTDPADVPGIGIPSGSPVSLWPAGGYQEIRGTFLGTNNRMFYRGFSTASDGTLITNPQVPLGYHVFDDCLWMTGSNAGLSGDPGAGGLYPMSPYNGSLLWFRPAERIIATRGTRPSASSEGPDVPEPGHFHVHRGLEKFGASEIMRMSRSWNESITSTTCGSMGSDDERTTTIYWQRYSLPTLDHTEQASSFAFCEENDFGTIGNGIGAMFFDGTDYWVTDKFVGRVSRWTSALAFDGLFNGPIGNRRYYANGDYLYSVVDSLQVGDPMLPGGDINMAGRGSGSGIGKWGITAEPGDTIFNSRGTFTHDSAKPIEADKHVGNQTNGAIIHDIKYVASADATHVTPGLWCMIQFGDDDLYLLRIKEEATVYEVLESVKVHHTPNDDNFPFPTDWPYEFIHLDVD
jgi:hypothetical protein